jgi:hypothetical protein
MSQQTALRNSKRRHEKRIYTPLILANPDAQGNSDAIGLAALVRGLMLTDNELTQLRQQMHTAGERGAVDVMSNLVSAVSASAVLDAASRLTTASARDLGSVSKALHGLRSGVAASLTSALQELYKPFAAEIAGSGSKAASHGGGGYSKAIPAAVQSTGKHVAAPRVGPGKKAATKSSADAIPEQARDVVIHIPDGVLTAPGAAQLALASVIQPQKSTPARMLQIALGPQLAERAPAVLAWAVQKRPDQLRRLVDIAQPYMPNTADPSARITGALANITRFQLVTKLFDQALTQRPLQPLGLLNLERLEMIPLPVERGELAYSLPLAPNEKVTLAHREWSVREEQFSEFIEDVLENYSEQGVAQTDDIALSTSTQTNHSNALSMSQPVASATGVHVTSPLDTTSAATINDTATKEESKSQSRTVTALASTRTMKDHKISFTVTTVSGIEDFTAHLIENKHDDKSMRIDYFKRVRKWQSELYRYGVRLTYDVVLPDPGARLRTREVELQNIADELATEFSLALAASDISVSNYEGLADQYGVRLPAPPEQITHIEASQVVSFTTPDDVVTGTDGLKYTTHHRVLTLSVTAPGSYQLSNLNVFTSVQCWTTIPGYGGWINAYAGQSINLVTADGSGYCNLNWNLNDTQVPADGQITVFFRMQVAQSGLLRLTGTYVPTEATMEQWRLMCWGIIRDAAAARSAQHRSYLRERQGALQKQIAGDDPVRLRRMEREAIMRSVLEWLFPGFQDASSVLANLPSPGYLDPGTWQQVMQYGEYIKFVQTAIDWDNVMVFLYPYFWDTIWHEQEKIFLNHPDAVHREFLRAGAARVILAIQPGFEQQVVSLLDQGQLGNLPNQNRFQVAIDYVQKANADFAKTATGGGASEDPKEQGVLIGTWTDYTPSSALDIDTTVMPVIAG